MHFRLVGGKHLRLQALQFCRVALQPLPANAIQLTTQAQALCGYERIFVAVPTVRANEELQLPVRRVLCLIVDGKQLMAFVAGDGGGLDGCWCSHTSILAQVSR